MAGENNKTQVMAIQARMVTDDLRDWLMRWQQDGKPPQRKLPRGETINSVSWLRARLHAARTVLRQSMVLGVDAELLHRLEHVIARAEKAQPDVEAAVRLGAASGGKDGRQ